MAQWDKRDPRWLVTELGARGSNVGGWHWEEKNKMAWCKQRLHALTLDTAVDVDPAKGFARFTGIQQLDGEAYLTRRKGNKSLAVYDLCITLSWFGKLAGEASEVEGTMKVSEFALGNEPDDYVLDVTSGKSDEKYACLVEAVRASRPQLLGILAQFREELSELQQ